jgi:uncharacterized membrane protein
MADPQERVTTELSDAAESVEVTGDAVEQSTADAVGETTGAVGLLVGMLTGGLVIAAAAGFAVGVAVGVVVGRRATPPPARWQVWR